MWTQNYIFLIQRFYITTTEIIRTLTGSRARSLSVHVLPTFRLPALNFQLYAHYKYLFGGRANKLYYKAKVCELIKYVDVCSLYPTVNKKLDYPVGVPTILTKDFDPDIKDYFGFVKCKVLPPRGLYYPVLQCKSNGKLKFPLRHHCAENKTQTTCVCSDEARSMVGTWATPDLHLAVDLGFSAFVGIFWECTTSVWKQIRCLQNMWTHSSNSRRKSSGWPADCLTDAQKAEYVEA